MSLTQLPVFPGIGWKITKTPTTSTRVLTATSGVEYRAQNWSSPRWKFSIPIAFLRQFGSYTEQTSLIGFILTAAGQFAAWRYDDPFDDTATNQNLGTGTGSQTAFPLLRTIGGFTEPVLYCSSMNAVYLNGVLQTSGYTLTQSGTYGPDTLTFTSAPSSGAIVTVSFNFNFVCRFTTDEPELSNDLAYIWSQKALEFISVK